MQARTVVQVVPFLPSESRQANHLENERVARCSLGRKLGDATFHLEACSAASEALSLSWPSAVRALQSLARNLLEN